MYFIYGKGVVELTEAGVISGSTTIPAMNGYQNTWLNIYDRDRNFNTNKLC